ncbi:MAG: protein translocase subunit SecDF [Terrimonas sp.]|nr:protein translocase subunit SecDF [Terrimonas sp.]
MQLKGLVSFFTIILIAICAWQLSFTWFVRSHENKMKARAERYVSANMETPAARYPGDPRMQDIYKEDTFDVAVKERLKELLDSTKDTKITWWGNTYKKARESELNLGLDLQGGMNVTMEVELVGLLKSMSNNSKDPNFLKALDNANAQKANSNADFITLFINEYKKLAPEGKLASLFASNNQGTIKIGDADSKVESQIRTEAKDAINRTYRILRSRIDQFGVAQPNINLEEGKGIITVELPGIDDEARVRKYLQASANLQFWETYKTTELQSSMLAAQTAYDNFLKGVNPDDTTTAGTTTDANKTIAEQLQSTDTQKQASNKTPVNTKQLFDVTGTGSGWIGAANEGYAFGSVLINDSARVRSILMNEAVRSKFPADIKFVYGIPPRLNDGKTSDRVPIYGLKTYGKETAPLEGDAVTNARPDFNPTNNQPIVSMSMNPSGSRIWATLTEKSAAQQIPIAIVLDDIVYSAPIASEKIEGGNSQITGRFNVEEATDLANILKAGKLPAPAKIVQEYVVGPTLGADAIHGGRNAFIISFIVIFILMLIYYNTAGWVANIALILNLLFTIGVLAALGATLTAPGIAGLVLTIGMAVDTNVIIYERIKEELTKGKAYIPAINEGYKRSLPPVLDAHITTLLTAIILFYFGLGPVKGFATTQILGILLSLFCGILVSRWVTDWFTNKQRHLNYFTGVSKRIFKHASFKFIEYRKVAYGISVVVLVLGIGAILNGFNQGVEFSGGRSYQIRFDQPVSSNIEKIREELKVTFGENPVIKTFGANNQLDITTSYLIKDTREGVDSMVERKLFEGLHNYLPADLTYEKFSTNKQYKLGSKTVLPTISDDLKSGAKWATFWSLLVISLYIFIRFRDWRYSLGTIVALLHDVLVCLAVFSFMKGFVNFPLELDQHFIAAVLTVIGFSMNDTVIVFDRIREYSRNMRNTTKENVINRAINDTLSRTIMTSLTVFLVILILFIVGGEVTKGFAFAMLIGVVTGTYSSIFVAAPILVDLARKKPLGEADTVKPDTRKPALKKPATT